MISQLSSHKLYLLKIENCKNKNDYDQILDITETNLKDFLHRICILSDLSSCFALALQSKQNFKRLGLKTNIRLPHP